MSTKYHGKTICEFVCECFMLGNALGVGHSQKKPPLSIIPFIMTDVVCVCVNNCIYDT